MYASLIYLDTQDFIRHNDYHKVYWLPPKLFANNENKKKAMLNATNVDPLPLFPSPQFFTNLVIKTLQRI